MIINKKCNTILNQYQLLSNRCLLSDKKHNGIATTLGFVKMNKTELINEALNSLKVKMNSYSDITEKTWQAMVNICEFISLPAKQQLYKVDDIPKSFAFIHQGLIRAYITDEQGNEYNKRFFMETSFPGTMVALLKAEPSSFTLETLEDTKLILINHQAYRALLKTSLDLQNYHINYLEKHWLIKQEQREVSLVQLTATQRYQQLLIDIPNIEQRVPLFHIASHIGITPTQLSRIRKTLC